MFAAGAKGVKHLSVAGRIAKKNFTIGERISQQSSTNEKPAVEDFLSSNTQLNVNFSGHANQRIRGCEFNCGGETGSGSPDSFDRGPVMRLHIARYDAALMVDARMHGGIRKQGR